ncbi:MAG: hypothetical protein FJ404_06785 [Verrucomicrobia bacterium]|nr:hypothetical protein [Verrucomicrobiota bacterium]
MLLVMRAAVPGRGVHAASGPVVKGAGQFQRAGVPPGRRHSPRAGHGSGGDRRGRWARAEAP